MTKEELQNENKKLKERNSELAEILDAVPAVLYINKRESTDNERLGINIWSNKRCLDLIEYSQNEIDKMGYDYFDAIMHPDDIATTKDSIQYLQNTAPEQIFRGLYRSKPKNKDYQWYYSQTCVLKNNSDGSPHTFLSVGFEISEPFNSDNQMADALSEIVRLNNQLKLQSLSKREIEVLKLVAQGLTDDEIAKKIFLSKGTVHSYRNTLLKKTETTNTANLVAFAVKCGIC